MKKFTARQIKLSREGERVSARRGRVGGGGTRDKIYNVKGD